MSRYKVRNWSQYNESLKKRGSVSLWIGEEILEKWKSPKDPHFIGAPMQYSDDAILCMMAIKMVNRLAYRQWKKFHIGVCPETHEIIATEVTELETADCEIGPVLLNKVPKSVKRVIGDGAYDTWECYQAAHENGQKLIVPPREGAIFHEKEEPWQKARNDAIRQIKGLGNDEEAVKMWKKLVEYHDRSLVETAFSRFKGIFGPQLFSRKADTQKIELNLKAYVLNKMTQQGMPNGCMI